MIGPRRRRPEEGWLTLLLVALLIAILASAIDDPAWVNGRGRLTDGLVVFGMLGVAVGFIGPKVGWSRWTTHIVGALFAGLLIPIVVGWYALPNPSIGAAFHETARQSVQAYLDLAWRRKEFTTQELHYVVALGIVDVGHRAVRVLRRVRPSPPAQCRDHDRRRPAGEHVDDVSPGAAVPRRLHRGLAVPPDPDACVR